MSQGIPALPSVGEIAEALRRHIPSPIWIDDLIARLNLLSSYLPKDEDKIEFLIAPLNNFRSGLHSEGLAADLQRALNDRHDSGNIPENITFGTPDYWPSELTGWKEEQSSTNVSDQPVYLSHKLWEPRALHDEIVALLDAILPYRHSPAAPEQEGPVLAAARTLGADSWAIARAQGVATDVSHALDSVSRWLRELKHPAPMTEIDLTNRLNSVIPTSEYLDGLFLRIRGKSQSSTEMRTGYAPLLKEINRYSETIDALADAGLSPGWEPENIPEDIDEEIELLMAHSARLAVVAESTPPLVSASIPKLRTATLHLSDFRNRARDQHIRGQQTLAAIKALNPDDPRRTSIEQLQATRVDPRLITTLCKQALEIGQSLEPGEDHTTARVAIREFVDGIQQFETTGTESHELHVPGTAWPPSLRHLKTQEPPPWSIEQLVNTTLAVANYLREQPGGENVAHELRHVNWALWDTCHQAGIDVDRIPRSASPPVIAEAAQRGPWPNLHRATRPGR